MRRPNLLIINQYYKPDVASSGQLLGDLCEFLCSEGMNIHVITGQPSYTTNAQTTAKFEVLNGVYVHRVPMGTSVGRKTLTTRILGYLRFLWGSWRLSFSIARDIQPDIILTLSNPPFVGLIGKTLAKRLKKPYLYVLYDIHPDILLATKWVKIPLFAIKLWGCINSTIFKTTTKIIVPSESMKSTLLNKHVPADKVIVIPNWARPEINQDDLPRLTKADLGVPEENVLLLYAGNIGIMQQLDPILDAAVELQKQPITFLFIGEGTSKDRLMLRVREENLTNVIFLSYQPELRFAQIVSLSDSCFVTLLPGLDAYSAPSRAYTFLSAATSIITIMPESSELSQLVTSNECGWNVSNSEQLTNLLTRLMLNKDQYEMKGIRARDLYWNNYQENLIMKKYAKVISDHI